MEGFKFTVIGAGSTYTPELLEGFAGRRESLPAGEIMLYDIDARRLGIMEGFCRRYAARLGLDVRIAATTDLPRAVEGAAFINTQLRVGGNSARVQDEKIPMRHGLIGQETTGAGGFMKALRTIPVMLDICRVIQRCAPDAWVVNYTNPTGLVAEAVARFAQVRFAGFCSGGIFPKMWAQRALGLPYDAVRYDYVGLNHMNFMYNLRIHGRPATQEEFRAVAAQNTEIDPQIVELLGCIPSPYLQYYYSTRRKLASLQAAPRTRGEQVLALEQEIYAAYADPATDTKPDALAKRGGGGYSDVAMAFIDAVYNDRDTWMVVNVPNEGAVSFLPDDASVETACIVNAAGIRPLKVSGIPAGVSGLIHAVKEYEQLAVEAAVTGDLRTAKLALLAHPLVREMEIIDALLPELMACNAAYLPQFS